MLLTGIPSSGHFAFGVGMGFKFPGRAFGLGDRGDMIGDCSPSLTGMPYLSRLRRYELQKSPDLAPAELPKSKSNSKFQIGVDKIKIKFQIPDPILIHQFF